MRRRWPLKVDRLAKRLCSSPMSASTMENGGSLAGGAADMGTPAFAMSTASPKACSAVPSFASHHSTSRQRTSQLCLSPLCSAFLSSDRPPGVHPNNAQEPAGNFIKHAEFHHIAKSAIGVSILDVRSHLERGGLASRVGACNDDAAQLWLDADVDGHRRPLLTL